MKEQQSPFTLARFEYEQEHLYFIQRKLFARLELPKPVYLVGSRGTGKTTLLKALSWSEHLTNGALAEQLRSRKSKYIGVYIKLPEIQLGLISRWASGGSIESQANIFSHYLDLVWLEELLRAIAELAVADKLEISVAHEERCVGQIHERFPRILGNPARGATLRGLAKLIRLRRESIEVCASTSIPLADAISELQLISHVGEFGRVVAEFLATICCAPISAADSGTLAFKVCMDEGECLDKFQQQVLNTMLRLSRAPLFFVVSFVSNPTDPTTTVINGLSLQQADRELVPLDEMSEREFRALVEGVASVRIQRLTGKKKVEFDTYRSLGALDVNGLLGAILKESVSPQAKELLAAAEANRVLVKGSTERARPLRRTRSPSDAPPIYQTYLSQRLQISVGSETTTGWRRRRIDSADFRKRIVAAYLSICAEFGAEPRYASADVVIQTSDNCVRDYLGQLDEIFRSTSGSLERFVAGVVDAKTQDMAIKSASNKKYESLPLFGVNNPSETRALIDGLGQLTALLQSKSQSGRNLKSTERGRFVLLPDNSSRLENSLLNRSIREAAEAGFLRLLNEGNLPLTFRVHTSLAPKYGFSYRGAYYDVPLTASALERIRGVREADKLPAAVDVLFRAIERGNDQEDMFSGSGNG